MNWKHEKGYKVEGTIRGREIELYPIYIVEADGGYAFVSSSYLDPWNSGHTAHLAKGTIVKENEHNCILKGNEDGITNLIISEMGTDEIKNRFDSYLERYSDDPKYTFENQYLKIKDIFAQDIQM